MMADNYQYRVFIKSTSILSDQKQRKIEQYFQIRRKSGGGECGPLTPLADNTYCVAFKDQKVQQEVLERREHTLEFSDGPLVFIVTDSPPTPSSPSNSFLTVPAETSASEERSLVQPNNLNDESNSTAVPNDLTRRIVILGKTGSGKSSLANTLFGKNVCDPDHTPASGTLKCKTASGTVNGKSIKLIDTPGFFDTDRSDEEMKDEILKCLIESAPGPHVFIIVLRVDKYTQQEKEIINKMIEYFSEEALKYTTVLFTHGDQLPKETTIEEFVSKSKDLDVFVKKCGSRCNVIDNKYWEKPQGGYRSNEFQVKKLLNMVERIIKVNGGHHYAQKMLEELNTDIEKEQKSLKEESPNLSEHEIEEKAKAVVQEKWAHKLLRVSTEVLLKAFLSGGPFYYN